MTVTARRAPTRWPRTLRCLLSPLVAMVVASPQIRAQTITIWPLVMLTGELEEKIRLDQLAGRVPSTPFLLRSPSRLMFEGRDDGSLRIGLLGPVLRTVHNSGLPFSLNEGALWAGRGWNKEASAGVFLGVGPVRLILAPTMVFEQNELFQIIPYPQNATPARSVWANPFHPLPESIDLPIRFGDKPITRLDAGQSSLTANVWELSVGAATENLWWGPGIRNAITLSNNAPGFPHAFVQTRQPILTPVGTFDAQWILGKLSESSFFDLDATNNARSLSGLALTWSPASDAGLSIGAARIVMAARRNRIPPSAAFDVFRLVGQPNSDTTKAPGTTDQIFSLFARWVFPGPGFEAYAEWARFEEPVSFRDFLEYPGHSEGYTLGFQWARPMIPGHVFRLQGEATYLEPDPSLRLRPVAVTYTSRAVPQGFTQRGEALGAAIGPGASSQFLGGDVFAPWWRVGAYIGRIRWDNGTLFEPIVPEFKRQDVSLFAGLRGSVSWNGMRLALDFTHAARFDYLFQAYVLAPTRTGGIDLVNNTFAANFSVPFGSP